MEKFRQFCIHINNIPPKSNLPSCVRVSLKNREGKTVLMIEEKALFSDMDFRDLSSLCIGLKEAEAFEIRRVLILTNNALLETIIKNEMGEEYIDNYGFYPDIKKLMNNFEEVVVKVIGQEIII